MISFRFHLVSITAVFLGIAIGVVVGSTFVDRAIVDNLEERIETVSDNLDRRREENDALQSENGRLDEVLEAGAAFAVSDRLAGGSLLVLAVRGVDDDAVERVVTMATQAGAATPGVVWIEPSWALAEAGQVEQLAQLANVGGNDAERVRARAWSALVEELLATPVEPPADDPAGSSTTTTPAAPDAIVTPVLDALTDSPFLGFEGAGDGADVSTLGGTSPAVVVVTGTRAEPGLVPLVPPMVGALVDAGLPTVVAEVFVEPEDDAVDPPSRGDAALAAVADDDVAAVSTVDHLDRPEGAMAAVLAAADLRQAIVGHYGYGDGTAGPLPPWTELTPR